MPKGRKRTPEEYEKEILEAVKRMRKHKESLSASRNSSDWLDFLDNLGVGTTDSEQGQDFWEKVRLEYIGEARRNIETLRHREYEAKAKIEKRRTTRQSRYAIAKYFGATSKEAGRYRDYSEKALAGEFGYSSFNSMMREVYF